MFLTPDQLKEFTQRERSHAQRRVLDFWQIPYRVRPDKSLAVLTIHVERGDFKLQAPVQAEPELQD